MNLSLLILVQLDLTSSQPLYSDPDLAQPVTLVSAFYHQFPPPNKIFVGDFFWHLFNNYMNLDLDCPGEHIFSVESFRRS